MYLEPEIAEDTRQRMLAWRHDIHANPETAFEEHRTANVVANALMLMGIPVHRGLAGTGVVGTLTNGDGPSIALRADLDALNMTELGERATSPPAWARCTAAATTATPRCCSARPTTWRASSPSGHGALRLPAGRGERRRRPPDGRRRPVRAVPGRRGLRHAHFPGMPRGQFGIRTGTMTAYLDTFEIVITGRGCHGAMPETGIDPVMISAQLVNALQTIVSRRVAATDSAVVSVTQIHGGDTWNVVPESVMLRGTARTLDAAIQDKLEAAMGQICAGMAQTHGAEVALRYMRGYPGVVNTAAETAAAAAAAASLVGEAQVHTDIKPAMGSEDFAFMLQKRPGAYIGIGAGEGPNDPPIHNPYYDFNDRILPLGAAYWVALVKQQLSAA
jgi:amidohydrolase/hippurate hydrolase